VKTLTRSDGRVVCGDQDECILPRGHGGQLHASAVSAQGLRVVWAMEGWEDLILAVYGENPTWMSMR
jgi:hypothetical protein